MNLFDLYHGKYFSVLGDSISTFEGVSIPKNAAFYDTSHKLYSQIIKVSDTWWQNVIDALGGELLVNDSISGSTVSYNPSYEYPSYGCSDKRTSSLDDNGKKPDVIMIYLGTNDWGAGIKPFDDATDEKDDDTIFSVAYSKMLEKLKRNYPDAEIWCFTLAISYCSINGSYDFPYKKGGRRISEYCDAIRRCAKRYNCRLIELYDDKPPYDTIDGFHPNRNGMLTIANNVLSNFK